MRNANLGRHITIDKSTSNLQEQDSSEILDKYKGILDPQEVAPVFMLLKRIKDRW